MYVGGAGARQGGIRVGGRGTPGENDEDAHYERR